MTRPALTSRGRISQSVKRSAARRRRAPRMTAPSSSTDRVCPSLASPDASGRSPRLGAMEDIATKAVEAALNAGATYADARVMEIRTESMSARNGVVEALDRGGAGRRRRSRADRQQLGLLRRPRRRVGGGAAGRRAGRGGRPRVDARRRQGPRPRARVAGDRPLGERVPRGPVVRRPGREGRPPPGRDADDARPRRRPRRGQPPDLGHSQVARLVRGDEGRPAHRRERRAR